MHIETPGERSSELVAALADVWERSVRATHDFLAEDDIVGLRPEAESGIAGVERLTVAYDGGAPCGFAGSQDGKLEMLFVAPEARGRGVGRALLAHAVEHAGVRTLDVNEQNPQAVGFYEHEGFVVAGRSPVHHRNHGRDGRQAGRQRGQQRPEQLGAGERQDEPELHEGGARRQERPAHGGPSELGPAPGLLPHGGGGGGGGDEAAGEPGEQQAALRADHPRCDVAGPADAGEGHHQEPDV